MGGGGEGGELGGEPHHWAPLVAQPVRCMVMPVLLLFVGILHFNGNLDAFVRTASKYDDCRMFHFPDLKLM